MCFSASRSPTERRGTVMLHIGSLRTAGSQSVGGTRQMLNSFYSTFPERQTGKPRPGLGVPILSLSTVFNSRNHYNYSVRKAIRTRASKLPSLNCLYQKFNPIKLHNFDNEQYSSLSAVLLSAAGCGCSEGQDYKGRWQAWPSECPSVGCSEGWADMRASPALSLGGQPWPIPRATSLREQTLSMH